MEKIEENLDIMISLYLNKLSKNSNSLQSEYLSNKISFLQCLREVLWVSESEENKKIFIENMLRD